MLYADIHGRLVSNTVESDKKQQLSIIQEQQQCRRLVDHQHHA